MLEKDSNLLFRETQETREKEDFDEKRNVVAMTIGSTLMAISGSFPPIRDEPDEYAKRHLAWIRACIETQTVELGESDYQIVHPKNPKTEKKAASARCIHNITGINISEDQADNKIENGKRALIDLKIILEDYVEAWEIWLTKRNGEIHHSFSEKDFQTLFHAVSSPGKHGPPIAPENFNEEKNGLVAETYFEHALLTQFGFLEVPRSQVGEHFDGYVYARSTKIEDQRRNIDFHLYNKGADKWVPIDFTTNPQKLADSQLGFLSHQKKRPNLLFVKFSDIEAVNKMRSATPSSEFVRRVRDNLQEVLK